MEGKPMTTIATSPERAHREQLADLTRRMMRALEIADAAETPEKQRRAWERFYLRLEQIAFLTARPVTAWCSMCDVARAERESQQGQFENTEHFCLEHYNPVLERKAAERTAFLYGEDGMAE